MLMMLSLKSIQTLHFQNLNLILLLLKKMMLLSFYYYSMNFVVVVCHIGYDSLLCKYYILNSL